MTDLAGILADFSRVATGSLVAAVWQGVLLTAVAWFLLRLLPKTPAAVRFAIWFGVFLVVTGLPVVSLWPHAGTGQAGGHRPWLTLDARWSLTIAAMWLLASAWRAGQLVVAAFRVRALWKRAKPVEIGSASFLHPTHRDRAAMDGAPGLLRRVELCASDEVDRPTVIGFFAPRILIPAWLLEKLTLEELEQVVLHESGHLGRADDWMNLLQKIALVVFPLNPALAWVERRLCFERELACDERVLRATGAPKAYAACLATLAEYRLGRRGLALAIGVLGRESELGQRVGRILRRGPQMKPWHARLVLGGAMLGLVVAATALERCPHLVGFSDTGNREEGTRNSKTVGALEVQPVVFRMGADRAREWKAVGDADVSVGKRNKLRSIPQQIEAIHKVSLAPERAVAIAQRMPDWREYQSTQPMRASAEKSGQREDVVVTQWTMVTQFHDGSRMVLTTAQVSSSAPRIEQDSDIQEPAQQEVYPFAAFPVRDGWLLFQL